LTRLDRQHALHEPEAAPASDHDQARLGVAGQRLDDLHDVGRPGGRGPPSVGRDRGADHVARGCAAWVSTWAALSSTGCKELPPLLGIVRLAGSPGAGARPCAATVVLAIANNDETTRR
jgi:hypothetical protein